MRKPRYTEPEVTMASEGAASEGAASEGAASEGAASHGVASDPVCPLCARPIPPDVPQSRHHLIPRLRGGKRGPVVLLHQVCHTTIHKTLSETQLARNFNTVEALRGHPDLARFFDWVARRPPAWKGKTR